MNDCRQCREGKLLVANEVTYGDVYGQFVALIRGVIGYTLYHFYDHKDEYHEHRRDPRGSIEEGFFRDFKILCQISHGGLFNLNVIIQSHNHAWKIGPINRQGQLTIRDRYGGSITGLTEDMLWVMREHECVTVMMTTQRKLKERHESAKTEASELLARNKELEKIAQRVHTMEALGRGVVRTLRAIVDLKHKWRSPHALSVSTMLQEFLEMNVRPETIRQWHSEIEAETKMEQEH